MNISKGTNFMIEALVTQTIVYFQSSSSLWMTF